jgi:hypothetical protein
LPKSLSRVHSVDGDFSEGLARPYFSRGWAILERARAREQQVVDDAPDPRRVARRGLGLAARPRVANALGAHDERAAGAHLEPVGAAFPDPEQALVAQLEQGRGESGERAGRHREESLRVARDLDVAAPADGRVAAEVERLGLGVHAADLHRLAVRGQSERREVRGLRVDGLGRLELLQRAQRAIDRFDVGGIGDGRLEPPALSVADELRPLAAGGVEREPEHALGRDREDRARGRLLGLLRRLAADLDEIHVEPQRDRDGDERERAPQPHVRCADATS